MRRAVSRPGVRAAVEVVGAELVIRFPGDQDVPDNHEDGVGDHDDGLVLGGAGAVAAPFHDVPVVEEFQVALVPDCGLRFCRRRSKISADVDTFSSAVTTPGGLVSGLQECLDGAAFVHGW
jgi:hypothetical protein